MGVSPSTISRFAKKWRATGRRGSADGAARSSTAASTRRPRSRH
ncbi:hypothetical protein [Corynebacterium sp. CCM 9203]